jgi:predicted lipoprotein with Yx(FWY)xxD motif
MSRSRITIALFSLVALALLAAGCGGGGSSTAAANTEASASGGGASASGGGMTVAATEVSGLGTVLVDSKGFTVYEFAKDKGSTSTCYGACEQNWPPVTVKGQPKGEGEMASQLGTTKRKDGSVQVTFAGRPLYTYAGDTSPGEANGNGLTFFGGMWSAMDESGEAVSSSAGGEAEAAPEESESSGGGYGY